MRRTIILSTTFATLLAFAQPAQADYVDDCNQSQDMDLRIGGCTALIRSGDYSGVQLGFAYNNRGIAYFDAGEYSQAIENYNRSLDFDPSDPDYYNNRGNAYSKLKQYARAIDDYDRSIRLDPGKAFAYNGRGAAYRHLGENALAIEDYSRALRIEPGYSKAYYNRGIAYDNLDRYRRRSPTMTRRYGSTRAMAAPTRIGAFPMKTWAISTARRGIGSRRSGSMAPRGQNGGRIT